MHISFNGVIKPYTYNCPYAHKLRNIKKIYPERKEEKQEEEVEERPQNRREFGIEQHDLAASYIKGEIDEYEFSTPVMEWFRSQDHLEVEITEYFSLDLEYLGGSKPDKRENYISCRKDVVTRTPHKTTLMDLKFGNQEYNSAVYYDETDFFIMLDAARNWDVGEWETIVHFPISNYSLPRRKYNANKIARLQNKYLDRIDRILNDKRFIPSPSKAHCAFCDYRSVEAGGCGACEYAAL
jgi:hypothetical protein